MEGNSSRKMINVSLDGDMVIPDNDNSGSADYSKHYEGGKWIIVDKSM
jgi:hypothetical protein